MSVRVTPWKKGPAEGYEIDIRLTWPDGGRYRERLKSPVSGKDASVRWGKRREGVILQRGREALVAAVAPATTTHVAEAGAHADMPDKLQVPTLAEFQFRFLREYATANGQHQSGIDAKESVLRLPSSGTPRRRPGSGSAGSSAGRRARIAMSSEGWRG